MSLLIGSSTPSLASVAAKSGRAPLVGSPSTPSLPLEPEEQPQTPPEWCGKYCIAQRDYNHHISNVGSKALKMLWLQKRLGDRLAVEPSASVPFGTLKELLGHHHENASINAIITHRLKAVAELDPDAQRLEWASELKTCRDAVSGLKVPELMRSDLLDAMFRQNMTVPTHRVCWERFRQDLAGACAQLFSPAVLQSASCSPLDLPVSLLVKDTGMREYDFTVSVDSQGNATSELFCVGVGVVPLDRKACAGDVSGEVRLPHSRLRGFRFAARAGSNTAATVQLPLPGFGRSHDTSAVVVDGIEVPESLSIHHAEAKGMMDPPKTNSWEGDNMMLVPFYKEHVYKTLANAARTSLAAFNADMTLDGIQLKGYTTPNMQVLIEDLHVTQSECTVLEGSDWLSTARVKP